MDEKAEDGLIQELINQKIALKNEMMYAEKNVVTVDSLTIDEIVRYVYGYDEENDKWI